MAHRAPSSIGKHSIGANLHGLTEFRGCYRRGHNIVVRVASTDSQDMEDLEAEMEEELDSAYEEGVNVDVVPGANLSRNSGRRLKRQEDAGTGGRRKREEDAFDQRILQACLFSSSKRCTICMHS